MSKSAAIALLQTQLQNMRTLRNPVKNKLWERKKFFLKELVQFNKFPINAEFIFGNNQDICQNPTDSDQY
jgi:hypothetical protein